MDDNNGIALPGTGMATAHAPKSPRKPRARRSGAKVPKQPTHDPRTAAVRAAEEPPERMMRARTDDARFQRKPVRQVEEQRAAPRTDGRLTRTRKRSTDPTYIDKKIVPHGMSYEFKAISCFGESQDAHVQNLRENHWVEVPKDRHPGIVTRQGGLVLMERPAYLTDEAKIEDYQIAKDQVDSVSGNMRKSDAGQAPRDIPALDAVHKNNSTYERLAIPED